MCEIVWDIFYLKHAFELGWSVWWSTSHTGCNQEDLPVIGRRLLFSVRPHTHSSMMFNARRINQSFCICCIPLHSRYAWEMHVIPFSDGLVFTKPSTSRLYYPFVYIMSARSHPFHSRSRITNCQYCKIHWVQKLNLEIQQNLPWIKAASISRILSSHCLAMTSQWLQYLPTYLIYLSIYLI
jgi:hypothetical protein